MENFFSTRVLKPSEQNIALAANELKKGEVVAIPTETVYGLAANALNESAVKKIFNAKGRPSDNPLICHIADVNDVFTLAKNVPKSAVLLAQEFWPGPLTMVLQSSGAVCPLVSAGLKTVGLRMPSHEVALKIIKAAGVPLAAPSANTSGSVSPTKAQDVFCDMQGKIKYIVDAGACMHGLESTVISLADENEAPVLLRPGTITKEQIEIVLKAELQVSTAITSELESGQKAQSPGMKYTHYAPNAKLILIDASTEKYIAYVNEIAKENKGVAALCFDGEQKALNCKAISYGAVENAKEQAQNLFSSLRKLDELGVQTAYAHCPNSEGIGLAVYNRILRAAAFRVVQL